MSFVTCTLRQVKKAKINAFKLWWGSQEDRNHQEDTDNGRRITLKFILQKYDRKVRTGFNWLRIGTSGGIL
jgi:hypothetical protein